MNTKELREQSPSDLKQRLLDLLKEQFNIRMQKGMGEMPRPHNFKRVRKDIARVKTILHEKGDRL